MNMTMPPMTSYSAVIGSEEPPTVRICSAKGAEVLAFRLPTRGDVNRFVDFLNDNQIEAVHVKDCFHDFLIGFFAET